MIDLEQRSEQWLALRKTKITATDACAIMGVSKWKKRKQLLKEKHPDFKESPPNDRMQRGIDLEDSARELFIIQSGIIVNPAVMVKDWMMASLDGISKCGKHIVEIKCAGKVDHKTAKEGKVPSHYYPQLQHQMIVCDLKDMYYYSFDGIDGVIVEVKLDQEYCDKMLHEEYEFYCEMKKSHLAS